MTTDNQPLVSVVTPVYNGEAHLVECIESVLSQTYKNWEYIIVNNCSTDRSLQIAHEFQNQDHRIRVCDNAEFLPMLDNQNRALRQISPHGKYCKIVFADDFLFPDCLQEMIRLAEKNPSVGIVGSYGISDTRILWGGLPYGIRVVPGREICRARLFGGPYVFGTASSVLYRSDIVRSRHPFYDERNIHADTSVCYEILQTTDFGFVHQILSFSRESEESASSFTGILRTTLPAFLCDLTKYGEVYLRSDEYEKAINAHMQKYYHFLGTSCLRFREKPFWEYHRYRLAELGYPMNYYRVLAAALLIGFREALSNPSRAAKELHHNLRRGKKDFRHHPAVSSMPASIRRYLQS